MSCTSINCCPRNCISAGTICVSQFVRTNNIDGYTNGEITINGLNPSLLVSNIPINATATTGIGFIADRKVRVVSVGEIHMIASSINSSILIKKNGIDLIANISSFNGSANVGVVQTINNANNVLEVDDFLVFELSGGALTDLSGGVITITLNEL